MTVSGEKGALVLGETGTFNSESQFVLNSNETEVSGIFDFTSNNTLDAKQSVTFTGNHPVASGEMIVKLKLPLRQRWHT